MPPHTLRLLSWNIQCGIETQKTSEYLTRGWRHLLPHKASPANLRRIAGLLTSFDVVALQEVDGGSLRSGFLNQLEYLADLAGFPFWHSQRTRNLAQLGQHGNGVLSRFPFTHVIEHRLPGLIPGRGGLEVRIGDGPSSLVLVDLHLALGSRARKQQLAFMGERLCDHRYVVVMGDMNSDIEPVKASLEATGLRLQTLTIPGPTFPSWEPIRAIDHILVSPELRVQALEVLPYSYSDHLPVAMQIAVPEGLLLAEPGHRAPLVPVPPPGNLAR